MQTTIGLSADVTKNVAGHLNRILSDEYVFLTKLLKYHWNITGPYFFPLHKLLDDQYREVFGIIDEVAERTRSIGHIAYGTLQEFAQHTRLKEVPGHHPSALEMVAELVKDHETIIMNLRRDIPLIEDMGDFGTMDFLTGVMEKHEKMAWFLRAHLQ